MLIFGVILLVIGGILFFVQKYQKEKLQSVKSARSATVAELRDLSSQIAQEIGQGSWRDYVKVNGVVQCETPLTSELRQEPCVYYSMSVSREYEETVTTRDSEGKTTTENRRGSETVSSNTRSIPFQLKDATGTITVNPNNANIETVSVLDDFRTGQPDGGMISFGGFSLVLSGTPSTGRRTIGYRYRESILPLGQRIFVLAMVSDSGGELMLIKPSEPGRKFLISLKSEEEVAKSTEQAAMFAFYGMVACLALGAILSVLGLLAG